jgi:serine/threonine protein phosphatase PrpC
MTALTDVGLVRELNEDNFKLVPDKNLAIVCDGMGGHAAGEVASQLAVDTIAEVVSHPELDLPAPSSFKAGKDFIEEGAQLVNAIRLANRRIYLESSRNSEVRGMGTTVVAALFDETYVVVCHVGDSRVYRFRNENLEQLTVDHSWVNELINSKQLTEEESKNFISKNVITRALGTREDVKVDIRQDRIAEGDIYLLCSDGLCGFVSDGDILKSLARKDASLDQIAGELIERANAAGGEDNITVSLVKVAGVGQPGEFEKELQQLTVESETDEELGLEDETIEKLFAGEESSETAQIDTRPINVVSQKKRGGRGWLFLAAILVLAILGYVGYAYDVGGFKYRVDDLISKIRGQPDDADAGSGAAADKPAEPELPQMGANTKSGKSLIQFDGFPDSLLDYTVYVDMKPVGTVRQYLTDKLMVMPGYRTLELKNDSGLVLANISFTLDSGTHLLTPVDFDLTE